MSNALMDALGYAGDVLEKPGRAVRGVLAGKGREALAAVPFSDSMGLTDYNQRTTGRDLTDMYGVTNKHDDSFGAGALGFGADMLTDPLNLAAGYGAYRAAPTIAKGLKAGAKALGGVDLLESLYGVGKRAKHLLHGEAGAVGSRSELSALEKWHASNGQSVSEPTFGGIPGKPDSLLDHQPWASDPDVPDYLRHAAGAVGPQYDGGLDNLQQALRGNRWNEEKALWRHGAVNRIAQELPPGTTYLGNGGEAIALRAPDGHVLRIAPEESGFGSKGRADLPEIVQPFRSQKFHPPANGPAGSPWVVEHLPMVNPVEYSKGHLEEAERIADGIMNAHGYDQGYDKVLPYRGAARKIDKHKDVLSNYLRDAVDTKHSGNLDAWDFHTGNISTTNEGNLVGHDGGMIKSMPSFPELKRFSALDNLSPEQIETVLKNGGPEEVRAAMRRGNAMGTKGQGININAPAGNRLAEVVEAQRVIKEWMESNRHYGVQGVTPNLPGVTGVASAPHGNFSPPPPKPGLTPYPDSLARLLAERNNGRKLGSWAQRALRPKPDTTHGLAGGWNVPEAGGLSALLAAYGVSLQGQYN